MKRKIVKVAEKTWLISDYYLDNMYLLEGDEKALLIDTGSGLGPLEKEVRELTDKPLEIVLTHGHADHIGGCHFFPDVACRIHPEDFCYVEEFENGGAEPFVEEYIRTRGPVRNPDAAPEEWDSVIRPYAKAKYEEIQDGYVFDLGNREVEVIHTPGHSLGSICLLDKRERLLFVGDTANDCLLLNYAPYTTSVREYYDTVKKLWDREDEYDAICQGHDTLGLSDKTFILDYIEAAKKIITKEVKEEMLDDGIHQGTGIRYGKVRLFYSPDNI